MAMQQSSFVDGKLRIITPRVFAPLLKPARYKGAWGGRGSGKSIHFAEQVIERQIMGRCDVVCLREVQRSTEHSVKREIEACIERLGVGHLFDVQSRQINGPNGSIIIFEGLQNHTADSIKSLSAFDVAWVEEAQAITQRSLDILRPTLRKKGSELWFSWNPENDTDPVDRFLRGDSVPDNAVVVHANFSDNPWFFETELVEEEAFDRRVGPADRYNHIWLGAYRLPGDALVFQNWREEEFDTPAGTHFRFGGDWGFSIDPSVLVRCYTVGRTLYIDYEAYQIGCETDKLPDLFMSVPESEKWPIVADSARPETINYMQRHGFPRMQAALKGAGSVEEGIKFLQSMEIVVHPRCKHTLQELRTYSYKLDKETGQPIPMFEDKNNHVIDALRYANEGARRLSAKQDIAPPPPPDVYRSWAG